MRKMGRAKLQIKRIENITNRQVTFSKRRNGLIKKAYEISILCDVDIALIMFSPSGRVSIFSGNRSIEEVLERFINLHGNERERLQNEEFLRMAIDKLRQEDNQAQQTSRSSGSKEPRQKDIQREILSCKSQLQDLWKLLRAFEGDLSEITSLCEAENVEKILEGTLRKVLVHKQALQQQLSSSETAQLLHQVNQPLPLPPLANSADGTFLPNWFPQATLLQIQAVSDSLNPNRVLGSAHPRREDVITASSSTLLPDGNAITENCNCIDIFQWGDFFPAEY